jgi:hypothetical protein
MAALVAHVGHRHLRCRLEEPCPQECAAPEILRLIIVG